MDDIDPAFNRARKTHRRSRAILALAQNALDGSFEPFQLFRILKP
jgi:hypothetical protein